MGFVFFILWFTVLIRLSFSVDLVKYIEKSIEKKNYIIIPEGTYYVDRSIVIKKNNIKIKGKGRVLIISKIQGKNKAVFEILGKKTNLLGYIIKAKAGQKIIEGFFNNTIGDIKYVWIYAKNTSNFVFGKLKSRKWFKERPYLRQGIYKVKHISSNTIILQEPLDISYPPNARVYAIQPVENITLENLTILQTVQEPVDYHTIKHTYENLYPNYKIDAIRIKWGANILLKDITVKLAGRHALNLEYSYRVRIKNFQVFGSLNKGKGGNGYIRFSKTHRSVLESCYIEGIRHLTFQWASSRNVVKNCILKVDINFHGGYERFNKVIESKIIIPKEHPWAPIEKTPLDAHWAPPSGPGNEIIDTVIKIE